MGDTSDTQRSERPHNAFDLAESQPVIQLGETLEGPRHTVGAMNVTAVGNREPHVFNLPFEGIDMSSQYPATP